MKRIEKLGVWLSLGFLGLLALSMPAFAAPGDTLADRVLGQQRMTTSSLFRIDGRVFSAMDVAVDRSSTPNRIYLADTDLNRVLGWSDVSRFRAGMSADLVLGQPSLANGIYFDFPDEECPETASATSFCRPTRVAVSPHGDLYVVDSFNYRVLEFDRPFATDRVPDRVFGQPDFTSREHAEAEEPDPYPGWIDAAVDGGGNLWMTATDGSRRVLEFDDPLTHDAQPDRVLEPMPLESCSDSRIQDQFCVPFELAFNPQGDLYLRDFAPFGGGDRGIKVYLKPLTTDLVPDFVLHAGAPGLAFDAAGNLYFASGASLLRIPAPIGASSQPETLFQAAQGDFSGRLDFDTAGNLYVAGYVHPDFQSSSNFVYVFAPPYHSRPARVGRVKSPAESLWHPSLVAVDRSTRPNRLYALDAYNRVLGWRDAEGLANGAPPDLVIEGNGTGHRPPGDFCPSIDVVVNASRFCAFDPWIQGGLAVDSRGNLWLSDVDNHRVLEFDRPFETDGVADRVLGQRGSFTTNDCNRKGRGPASLCYPGALAFDGAGNLYVADQGNHRVLLFLDPRKDSTADKVFGQAGFQQGECNRGNDHPGAATLCSGHDEGDINVYFFASSGLAVDSAGTLYVADRENVRVLAFRDALHSSGRADAVLGQDGRFGTALRGTGPRRFGGPEDGFSGPGGLAVGPGGDLYVADATNDRILVFHDPLRDDTAGRVFGHASLDAGGTFYPNPEYYGNVPTPTAARLLRPASLAFDVLGNLWVADRDYNRILRFDRP
jgi:DNA-binding beta-propeller fold protein YncE